MIHFIYHYSEEQRPRRNGTTYKTVRLWRIKKNVPVYLGAHTETFVDQNQLVMITAERYKALPKKWFESHPMLGGFSWSPWGLKEKGVAQFYQIW